MTTAHIFLQDYYDPLSALTEEDEQTWLFPAGEELPLPLSLESNDTDYEFSELAQSHQQQSDLDVSLLAHMIIHF